MMRLILLMLLVGMSQHLQSGCYLWQMDDESESSCCIHMDDVDICNPGKSCTRFLRADLNGIDEYLVRLLITEKGSIDEHAIVLKRVQRYVRSLLANPYRYIAYRFDVHRVVQFYHDLIVVPAKGAKPAEKPKSKEPEKLNPLLLKYGLIKFNKPKNR